MSSWQALIVIYIAVLKIEHFSPPFTSIICLFVLFFFFVSSILVYNDDDDDDDDDDEIDDDDVVLKINYFVSFSCPTRWRTRQQLPPTPPHATHQFTSKLKYKLLFFLQEVSHKYK